MSQTVIGIFDDANQARQTVQQLEQSGFQREFVDVAAQQTGAQPVERKDDDSITNFFRSLFGSDDTAERYTEVARRGNSLVTVHAKTPQEAERARDILDRCGAVDVEEKAQQYRSTGWTGAAAGQAAQASQKQPMPGQNMDRGADMTAGQSIPIIEEKMQVGKREVETGGARIRSRIVERPVEEHLRLREEHVWVERNQVNRPASEADIKNFKEGEVTITERAEVPVVNKEARVVEEVRLGKEVEQRDETVRGTVRKTDVDIERLDGDKNMGQNRNPNDRDNASRGL